ncbi:hypothetical protein KMZ93_04300 [Bradyrhizobium sediminis]|uniref:Uncharacterized protein n=1 Tax=Bradyrhizobium sediminis TaxID=2840469 RepID=A0A975NZH2_9BRAD|nr:hypothetical protein [Bradyrhizobium sediminis]QWG24157.1 hypothetical protein KMZ93_04300 [Bradyrhizobium sediminis]
MIDKVRLGRLVELKQVLDDTEAEIAELLGGDVEKPRRVRRTREQIAADERAAQQTAIPQPQL